MMSDAGDAVIAMIRRVVERPNLALTMAMPLDEIEMLDSLRVIEVVALLEDSLSVTVNPLALDGLTTVGDIARIISAAF